MALTKIDDRGLKTPIDLIDNEKIRLGTGNDLEIYHDGSNSFISDTGTGGLKVLGSDIYIRNASDQDMIHATSGGAVKLYYNNVKKFETTSDGWKGADNVKGVFGDGDDLVIYHSGSNSFIQGGTGNIRIQQKVGEDGIVAIPDGAIELYHNNTKKLETTSDGINVSGFVYATRLDLDDSNKILLGDADDLQIYHDGNNHIQTNSSSAGYLKIKVDSDNLYLDANETRMRSSDGGEILAKFIDDGAVELYHDGTKKFETRSGGIAAFGHIETGDSNKLMLGDANDLQVFHDGSNSYLYQDGTGELRANTATFRVMDRNGGETQILASENGAVELYYNNSKKLETTNTGGILTGEWTLANNYTLADITHATSAQTRTVTDSTNWVDVDSDGVNRTMSYKRGNLIVIDSQLPGSIALSSSGVNYAGVQGRLKITDGTNTEYSETHKAWYRNDDEGTDESVQFMAIKYLIKWDNTAFDDNSTLTVSFQFRRIAGSGTTTTSVCGWNSVRWISVTKYKGST